MVTSSRLMMGRAVGVWPMVGPDCSEWGGRRQSGEAFGRATTSSEKTATRRAMLDAFGGGGRDVHADRRRSGGRHRRRAGARGGYVRGGGEGVIGEVLRGKTTVWQIGEQKSFQTLMRVERSIPVPAPGRRCWCACIWPASRARDQGIAIQRFRCRAAAAGDAHSAERGLGRGAAVGAARRGSAGRSRHPSHRANWVNGPLVTIELFPGGVGNTIDGWSRSTCCCRPAVLR